MSDNDDTAPELGDEFFKNADAFIGDTPFIGWAKLSDLKEGDQVKIVGFTCIKNGDTRTVHESENGLYVECGDGTHMLDGQIDDLTKEDELLGVMKLSN